MLILKAQNPFEALDEVSALLKEEKTRLETKAEEFIPKPKELVKYPTLSDYKWANGDLSLASRTEYWFQHKSYYSGWSDLTSEDQVESRKKEIEAVIDKLEKDVAEVKKANEEIIAHNKIVQNKIMLIMKHIGVKDTYSERDTKSRSQTPKYINKTAGYILDLQRHAAVSQYCNIDIPTLRRGVETVYNERLRNIRQKDIEERQKKEAAEAVHKIALLRAKYTPEDAVSSVQDILENMLLKNKYLRLAHYLRENRGDWNDGYSYAETGLGSFSVDSPVDQEIYDCIEACIRSGEDGDIDGRIFRDCEYNYDFLFGLVEDQTLLEDYGKLVELSEEN